MNKQLIDKMVSRYLSGVFTDFEVADSLLFHMVVDEGFVSQAVPLVEELPPEIRQRLVDMLKNIQKSNYIWRPFLIGPGFDKDDIEFRNPPRIKYICELLDIKI